jgi:protein CpxP
MNSLIKLTVIAAVGIGSLGMMSGCAHGFMHMSPQERAEWIVKDLSAELKLDDAQMGKLNALKNELLAVRNDLQKKHGETSKIIGELLSQPTLDQARSLALIKERTQEVNDRASQIVAAFAGFYDSLTPQQQKKLHDEVTERLEHR